MDNKHRLYQAIQHFIKPDYVVICLTLPVLSSTLLHIPKRKNSLTSFGRKVAEGGIVPLSITEPKNRRRALGDWMLLHHWCRGQGRGGGWGAIGEVALSNH